MKKRLILIMLSISFFASCTSTRAYETQLDSWVGKSAEALTEKWGQPQNIQLMGDKNQAYQYMRYDKSEGKRSTASMPVSCETNFFVSTNGVVVGWTHSGYDCRSK